MNRVAQADGERYRQPRDRPFFQPLQLDQAGHRHRSVAPIGTAGHSPDRPRVGESERVDVPLEVVGQVDQQLLPLPLEGCRAAPHVVDSAAEISNE